MTHRSMIVSMLLLLFLIQAPSVFADVIDPIPMFKIISDSPPREGLYSDRTTLFLCPQSENFGNQPLKVITETLMMEALGEGYEGMVAVGEVIRNRTHIFMKNAEAVCLMPKQFSCWNDRDRAEKFVEKYREYYFVALAAWIESGRSVLTHGATDYHADSIHPYWADAYHVAARIGAHIFYVRS